MLRQIGNYKIIRQIGQGAMGMVYESCQEELHRKVALKVLPHYLAQDRTYLIRFKHEAEAAARIRHPYIATIYDYGEADGQSYIVMEFLEGKTLEQIVSESSLSIKQGLDILQKVADGLAYAHEVGIIHRDVKAGNVMVGSDGKVSLMDFGLAKMQGTTMLTVDGTILGTPAYMSPEQARGDPHDVIDCLSDIYSFGVLMYEVFTGKLPFQSDNQLVVLKRVLEEDPLVPSRINRDIPIDLQTIILKAMEKNPARRYQSVRSLLDDLRRFEMEEPILAKPMSMKRKIGRRFRKSKAVFIVSLVALSLLTLTSFYSYRHQEKVSQEHQRILLSAREKLKIITQEREILLEQLSEDPVFKVLNSRDPLARAQALILLNKRLREKKLKGQLAEESIALTIKSLKDSHPLVRKHAAMLLGVLKDSRAVEALMDIIHDEDAQVRNNVILALGLLEDRSAIAQIRTFLTDSNEVVRSSSALALGILKAESAVDELIKVLLDPFPKVRSDAAVALGSIGQARAIKPILQLMKDPVAEVRNSAKDALKSFGEKARIPMILHSLRDPKTTPKELIEILREVNPEKDEELFDELLKLLEHAHQDVRYHSVLVIGLFGKFESIPYLINKLKDENKLVREDARLALMGLTAEDFAYDLNQWDLWWKKHKDSE